MCACFKLASSGLKDFPKFGGKHFLAATKPSSPCPRPLSNGNPTEQITTKPNHRLKLSNKPIEQNRRR